MLIVAIYRLNMTVENKQLSYLPTTSLPFGSTFNNSRKVKQLNFGIIVVYNTRDASKCCEFI